MNLSVGIVGLPNVGKSTLFNALTASSVSTENYPFCTIEPNVGIIPLKDKRLDKIATIENSKKVIPAVVKFVDIAGLVKGASRGEGLGNKFLSHIREVHAIVHVIRNFADDKVSHVDETIDPSRDIKTIETELIVKDTETIEKKLIQIEKQSRGDKEMIPYRDYLRGLLKHLNAGKLAFTFKYPKDEELEKVRKELMLLTDKPIIYLINESQEKINENLMEEFRKALDLDDEERLIVLDAKLEVEISRLSDIERKDMLKDLDLYERPLDTLVRACYEILKLISFFTTGEDESRAWTINEGDNIVKAAAVIHNDFSEKFIAADVVSFKDISKYDGWEKCREEGKIKLVGREYIVRDGDVIVIRHGA